VFADAKVGELDPPGLRAPGRRELLNQYVLWVVEVQVRNGPDMARAFLGFKLSLSPVVSHRGGQSPPYAWLRGRANLPRDLPRVAFRDDRLSGDEAVQIPAGDVLHGNVERIVSCIPSQELDKIPRVLTWPGRVQTWDHMYLVHV